MKLIRNLKLWQKLVLVLGCFALPLFGLGQAMLSGIYEEVATAKLELAGVGLLTPVVRQQAMYGLSQITEPDHVARPEDLQRPFEALQEALKALVGERQAEMQLATLLPRTRSVAELTQGTTGLKPDWIALSGDIADASRLSLDPALDSYYLIILASQDGPELLAELSASREALSLPNGAESTKIVQSVASDRIRRLAHSTIPTALRKAIEADPLFFGTSPTLESRIRAALAVFDKKLSRVESLLERSGESVHAQQEFRIALTDAIEATQALLLVALEELSGLIQHRIDHHTAVEHHAWLLCGLGLAVLPAIAWLVIRSITQPVQELIDISLVAANQGDLTQKVAFISRDEIGTLATAFNRMIGNLRGMIEQVQQSGRLVQGTSTNISATAKQQQATATEIAATTLQIEATSKEISVTSAQLAATIKEVATVAEQTTELASTGREGITRMEDTMVRISDACTAISERLAVLSDKASKIGSVVTTINKVADQTNLLSLNAAIEAEKAGDVGRGFAVVATEIRRLADQTAMSTADIETMIKEIQSAVSAGVMGIERFADEVRRGVGEVKSVGGQLGQIISHVQALPQHIDTVRDGMESQALGARQITDGLGQLSQAAQQTADSLRSSNECIDQLKEASTMLESGIKRFKIQETGHAVS